MTAETISTLVVIADPAAEAAARKKAQYALMQRLAVNCGFSGINPEFLTSVRSHIRSLDWAADMGCILGVSEHEVVAAYRTIIADIRAMFAPA